MRFNYRLWIENERGEYVLGEGSFLILKEIQKTGSLSKAARNLEMSYSYVWRKIKKIERRTGFKIVESFRGGRKKGETHLTEYGKSLLSLYERVNKKIKDLKIEEKISINERNFR